MPIVSATRLHRRSKIGFFAFAWHSLRAAGQAKRSPGFLAGCVGGDRDGGAWTLTVWQTEADMRAFRNSGAHLRAMPRLLDLCDEASFAHWSTDSAELPAMSEAHERIKTAGRLSKVRRPSAAQAAGRLVAGSLPRKQLALRPRR